MKKSILRKNHPYIYNEILETGIKMSVNLFIKSFLVCFLLQLIFVFLLIKSDYSKLKSIKIPNSNYSITSNIIKNYLFDFSLGLIPDITVPHELTHLFNSQKLKRFVKNSRIRRDDFVKIISLISNNRIDQWKKRSLKTFYYSFFIQALAFLYMGLSIYKSLKLPDQEFVRGSKLTPRNNFANSLQKICKNEFLKDLESLKLFPNYHDFSIENVNLWINDMVIPRYFEGTHVGVLGTTGIGKSSLIFQLLDQLLKRQSLINRHYDKTSFSSKILMYDVKGEFVSRFYAPNKSVIFYPFDNRSINWQFSNEIVNIVDFDLVASSLFEPPDVHKDVYWYNSARDIFSTGLKALWRTGKTSNRDITLFFNNLIKEIKITFKVVLPQEEHGAIKHIDNSESQTAASIISILQERIYFFKYISRMGKSDFSFRGWVNDSSDHRNLFLLNVTRYEKIFQPLMTLCIDIMFREILSILNSPYSSINIPRFSVVIDEFGSLSKLSSIIPFISRVRGLGGSLILSSQDLSQIKSVYGEDGRATIFNNINLILLGRINDPNEAKLLSDAMGQSEVIKRNNSHQVSPDNVGDRVSINTNEKIENVILPSQLSVLDRFNYYIKFAGIGQSKTTSKHIEFPIKNLPYIEKSLIISDFLGPQNDIDMIQKLNKAILNSKLNKRTSEVTESIIKENSAIDSTDQKPFESNAKSLISFTEELLRDPEVLLKNKEDNK